MDQSHIIILKGVRKPTHWFSIQTLDLASGLLHCMRDEMVWDPRSDSCFFIKSKIFNWGIVLFLRVYKTLTHRYHIVTVTQNQQVARPPPSWLHQGKKWSLTPAQSSAHLSIIQMGYFSSLQSTAPQCAWILKEAFSFSLPGKPLLSIPVGCWFST